MSILNLTSAVDNKDGRVMGKSKDNYYIIEGTPRHYLNHPKMVSYKQI